MNTTLGDYYISENITTEHKSLHIPIESIQKISDDDVFNLIKTGKINTQFAYLLHTNLLKYVSTIIPKYISCFSNANINGVINFGIDDSCEISGVPSMSNISKKAIQNCVYNSIKKNE